MLGAAHLAAAALSLTAPNAPLRRRLECGCVALYGRLTAATSAPGLNSPIPRLHRDWARCSRRPLSAVPVSAGTAQADSHGRVVRIGKGAVASIDDCSGEFIGLCKFSPKGPQRNMLRRQYNLLQRTTRSTTCCNARPAVQPVATHGPQYNLLQRTARSTTCCNARPLAQPVVPRRLALRPSLQSSAPNARRFAGAGGESFAETAAAMYRAALAALASKPSAVPVFSADSGAARARWRVRRATGAARRICRDA